MAKRNLKSQSATSSIDYGAAAQWFAETFGLAGWEITLYTDDDPPAWMDEVVQRTCGCASINLSREMAQVWVSAKRTIEDDDDPLSTLFHEMLHILAVKAGIRNHGGERREFVWNRLGDFLAVAYRAIT